MANGAVAPFGVPMGKIQQKGFMVGGFGWYSCRLIITSENAARP